MKTNLLTILILLATFAVYAQKGVINNGAKITISNGAILEISGAEGSYINNSFDASSHGEIDLDGKIKIDGNWVNNATTGYVLINRDNDGEVIFSGSGLQLIEGSKSTYFENLTLNNSAGLDLSTQTSVDGNLTLTSGVLNIGANDLYLASGTSILGTLSSSAMIVANSSGYLRKYFSGTGSFTFPVGDTTDTDEYSPYAITFNSGTFGSGGYLQLNVVNDKHPNNSSSTHYINRYWSAIQYNITSFDADITASYKSADINSGATESSIYMAKYDSPYWSILDAANTGSNTLTGNITSFSDFTGAESGAIVASIIIEDDGTIDEEYENGEIITVVLSNDDFVSSLNTSNWTITNLPDGVTKGSITRVSDDTVTIVLSGNRSKDFDSDILDVTVSITSDELVNTGSGSVNKSNGVTIIASSDAESITMADDGLITEGSEAGEVITVSAVGGTFATTITPANWTLSNMPSGITKGAVTRIDEYTVEITLAGTAVDYDSDSINTTLTITAAEIDEYTGSDLIVNTGVIFTAVDESFIITMANTNPINEGSENGGVIGFKINKTFSDPLILSNWTAFNLPEGVSMLSVTRDATDHDSAIVVLNSNSIIDYDADITNISFQIDQAEFSDYSSNVTVSTGVTLTATDDAESIAISNDGDGITEGSENGEVITVLLSGGTFADPIDSTNWTVTNLPVGVTIGSYTRISATIVELTLSGNRCCDFDSDITNITVTVTNTEIDDHTGADISDNFGVTITAVNTADESITLANDGDGILEGAEDGEIITVTLSDGTFVSPLNASNWSISNQPTGVSLGSVEWVSNTEIHLVLSGNATVDYDTDILNFTVEVDADGIDETTVNVSANSNVTFTATDEPVTITLLDDGIYEGAEDGEIITVVLDEDTFVGSLTANNWTLTNLPAGVTMGTPTRISADTVTITLSGNRTQDYDTDITNVTVEFTGDEITQHSSSVSQNTGLIFDAANDAESISIADDGEIIEGAEAGEIITVTLAGGTFANPINPTNWTLSNLPNGVTKGTVIRASETSATISLSGNRTTDYDSDITDVTLSITDAEIDDYTGTYISKNSGITFTAIVEAITLTIADDGINEGAEHGEVISVTITDDTFVDPINESNWSFTGLPVGVTIDSVERTGETTATITLLGNRTVDYDASITNAELTINGDEFVAQSVNVSQNTGVTFIAVDNAGESISMTDDGSIIERSESGEVITVTVSNGTFAQSLNSSNWSLTNQPTGISIGSLFRLNSTTIELTLSGNTSIDYDSNISDLTLSIPDTDIDDYSGSNLEVSTGVTFVALSESLAISHTGLTEDNIDGAEITLILTNDKFIDATLDNSNFTLNSAPAGLIIDYISYVTDTSANLYLSFNNTDFDVDITDFSITVNTDELIGLGGLTSNDLTISATVEDIVVTMADDGISEGEENNEVITVVIAEDEFVASLTPSNWVLSNLPLGVSYSEPNRISSDTVAITLIGNRTKDFDSNISNIKLDIAAVELVNSSSSVSLTSGVSIIANNDNEYLVISDSGISEGAEDGEIIYVSLVGGTFANTLNTNNWVLNNLPVGVTKGTLTKIDSITAQITLVGNATIDYDNTIYNIELVISADEIDEHTESAIFINSGVELVANDDEEVLTMTDDGVLNEGFEDGEVITVKLSGGTFVNPLDELKWDFQNLPVGVSIDTVKYIDVNTVEIVLSGNRTEDYDDDIIDLSLSINTDQINDNDASSIIISSGVTFSALKESASITHAGLTESNLNTASVNLKLTNETFVDATIEIGNITLIDVPNGLAINSISYLGSSEVNLILDYDGTDFDSHYTNFHVLIDNSELVSNENLMSDTLTITATDDVESISMSDDGNITEGAEDSEQIEVTLTGGTFVENLDINNWLVSNIPEGVSIGSLARNSNTSVTITLNNNTTSDYDIDITDLSLSIYSAEVNDVGEGSLLASSGVTFVASVEELAISHAGLSESNLNGAVISLSLTNEDFIDTDLSVSNFTLNNAPPGVSVQSVTYNSITTADLVLSFDGTDFDVDFTTFSISIESQELTGAGLVTSNTLSISAVQEIQTAVITHDGLTEENLDQADVIYSLDGDIFADVTLDPANFSLNDIPDGTGINSVSYINDTAAKVTLSFDGTDFDSDHTSFNISVTSDELNGSAGITSNNLTITATNDNEVLSMSSDGLIEEGSEDGEIITISLEGGTFATTLNTDNWTILNLPVGVAKGTITKINTNLVEIQLSGNASEDYDIDITNIEVQVNETEVNDYSGSALIVNTGITFIAIVEVETKILTISAPDLNESSLNGASILAELTADYLIDETVDFNNITLLNAPIGMSIYNIDYQDSITLIIEFAFDGTDFDSDITNFQIIILGDELNSTENLTSNELTITAVIESQSIVLTHVGLTEENFNTATISLALVDEQFIDNTLDSANFKLSNAPDTSYVFSVEYINDTAANVTVFYDGTDFDTDITDFGIVVLGEEFASGSSIRSENLTITATDDEEVLTMSDDGEIIERSINGEIITVAIAGGNFATLLTNSNWNFTNAPQGLEIVNVVRVSDFEVQLELGEDGIVDFDTNITNLTLSIINTEINDYSGSNIEISSGITLTAIVEEATISHVGLTEENLSGAIIPINLVNESFASTVLDKNGFALIGFNEVSINSVTYLSASSAEIEVLFFGQDFDAAQSIAVHISGSELMYSDTLVSNTLTISATDDNEIFTMSDDGEILEGSENREKITITLSGGTFVETPEFSNWIYSNMPAGVTIGSTSIVSDTVVELLLSGNSTVDYDTNLTQFSVVIPGNDFNDFTDANIIVKGGVTFTAIQENTSLTIAHAGLTEENLSGATISLDLSGDTFIDDVFDENNFALIGFNEVSVQSVTYSSETSAEIEILFTGQDFDTDKSIAVHISGNEIVSSDSLISNSLTIIATDDIETFTMSDDDEILEGSENGEKITITLSGGTFVETPEFSNWIYSNMPIGVTVGSATLISDAIVEMILSGNATVDYDTNLTQFSVVIPGNDFNDFTDANIIVKGGVTFTAIQENTSLSISHEGLNEANLDGAVINLELEGETFFSGIKNVEGVILNNAPEGLFANELNILDDTLATIVLGYTGSDFDVDYNDFSITVAAELLNSTLPLISNTLPIIAIVEPDAPELLVDFDGEILEGYENSEVLMISLLKGYFIEEVSIDSIYFSDYPTGVSFGNLVRISDTLISIGIIGNRTVDYDADITDINCTLEDGLFVYYTGDPVTSETPILFKSYNESLSISAEELNEGKLNDAEILLNLTDDIFVNNTISLSSITLFNAPIGLETESLEILSDSIANLSLSYDGTDITSDITDFYIGISASELHGVNDLNSNNLTIYEGVGIVDQSIWNINIYAKFENVIVSVDEIQKDWSSATITIYDAKGQMIHSSSMVKTKINVVKLNVYSGFYFVKVKIDGTEFVNKVFIVPE